MLSMDCSFDTRECSVDMMLPNYTFVNIGKDSSERHSYVIAAHTYMCRQTLIGLFKYP